MATITKKQQGDVVVCAVDQYLSQRNAMIERHPGETIIKEIENMFFGMVEVPDPQLIGQTRQQQALMIAFLIVFEFDNE